MTHVYQVLLSSALPVRDYCITNNNLLTEVICCCLQTCNVVASEVMLGDTCIPSLIVIGIFCNQFHSNVLPIALYCLRLFVVVYKHLHSVVFY